MKQLILYLFSIINLVYPKNKNKIIFISSPDFSDNSFAVFKYMLENGKTKKKYIWLVDHVDDKSLYVKMMQNNIGADDALLRSIPILSKTSLQGIWQYIQGKYVFFTHGFYTGVSLPNSQTRINLWHGMPLKAIGFLNKYGNDETIPKSSVVLATSKLYKDIMGKVFDVNDEKVWITGQPRCDLLWQKQEVLEKFGINKTAYKKIILWTPTYRYDKEQKVKDGKFTDTLPLLKKGDLKKLNLFLTSVESHMVIKLHPMDILNTYEFEVFSHITILKEYSLLDKGCQLYGLLAEIDILITDFSSIYIDFLLLDRPIIFAIDDFDEYTKTRDFVFLVPKEYMPGVLVENTQLLIQTLEDTIINGSDSYANQRNKIKKEFHTYENNFSKRLLESLEL